MGEGTGCEELSPDDDYEFETDEPEDDEASGEEE